MRKILTFLFAALMSASMFALTPLSGDEWDDDTKTLTVNSNPGLSAYEGQTVIEHVIISNSVTSIGQSAFKGCSGLTSVTIGNSVESIGDYAFENCTGLKWVSNKNYFPQTINGNVFLNVNISSCSLYVRSEDAFDEYKSANVWKDFIIHQYWVKPGDTWDEGTKTLTVNSNPEYFAYSGESNIEHVIISDGVTSMEGNAFASCPNLTSVTIGNSLVSIGGGAFLHCTKLTSVTIGTSVTSIGGTAFQECSGLTSITIPNGITSIGVSAFYNCTGLTSVTIPNSVTSIEEGAFAACTALTSVTNYATTPQTINSNVFNKVNKSSCTLYVPEGYIGLYEAAAVWTDFINIQAAPTGFDITANEDPQNAGVYYSTFYYGGGDVILPANVTAYKAAISDDALNLTSVAVSGQSIPAGNAVILKSSVQNYTLAVSALTSSIYSGNSLQGVNAAITNPNYGSVYVLSAEGGAVGFYKLSSGATIPAHKAYVTIPSGGAGAPKRLRFVFEQENTATGVENVQGDKVQSTKVLRDGQLIIIRNGVEYNANGMMVK